MMNTASIPVLKFNGKIVRWVVGSNYDKLPNKLAADVVALICACPAKKTSRASLPALHLHCTALQLEA
jgi:hypothetical protein